MVQNYLETEEGKRRFNNPEIYQATLDFQNKMKDLGVAWHNHFADECTVDFCCCVGDNPKDLKTSYNHFIPSYREVVKLVLDELYEECKHGDLEHQMWLKNKFKQYLSENF